MSRNQLRGQFPKQIATLTPEQQAIRDEFMGVWLDVLPKRFGAIEVFNHRYARRTRSLVQAPVRTLDIGAGLGAHAAFEDVGEQEYVALDIREELIRKLEQKYPTIHAVVGNIQERLEFPEHYFNRIQAIHVLEHLPDLPRALDEIKRLLSEDGYFSVLIPCDPGFAYTIGRNLSARRIFEQRYKQSYDWVVEVEHINAPDEIIGELKQRFEIVHSTYFPLLIPVTSLNLVIGLTLKHN